MTDRDDIAKYLDASKENRDAFVNHLLAIGIATQMRVMLDQRGWTRADLAEKSGLAQSTISDLMKPGGALSASVNTLKKVAAAFDVALIVKFCSFSELVEYALLLDAIAPSAFGVLYSEEPSLDR